MADITAEIAVIGLGATGSAALYHLARRGRRVVGIEQFRPAHDRGSSHGRSRIIRLGYFEHPSYVPLVRRAYELWRELERLSGRPLMTVTGIAEIGLPGSVLVSGTLASSREHGLPHEVLEARDIMRRYPAFALPDDFIGVVQPDAGFLDPENCVLTHLGLAKAAGAEIRTDEKVVSVEPRGDGVRIVTGGGTIEAGRAVVCAGSWTASLLRDLDLPLHVTRQVLMWFAPERPSLFASPHFPVFMLESDLGIHYGFPLDNNGGLKIAKHHHAGETIGADGEDRSASGEDEAMIRAGIARYLPQANGRRLSAMTCRYTMTPDGDFILDEMPGYPQIVIASPCSGHGFKFAPAIGEILADMAVSGATAADIGRFRLARFG